MELDFIHWCSIVNHGGARAGAGRKPGSVTEKTRAIAEAAIASGMSPLEVMLKAMQAHVDAGNLDAGAGIAKDAAPYIHPRLAAMEHTGADGGPLQVVVQKFTDTPDGGG